MLILTLIVPSESYQITLKNKYIETDIMVDDPALKSILDVYRGSFGNAINPNELPDIQVEQVFNRLLQTVNFEGLTLLNYRASNYIQPNISSDTKYRKLNDHSIMLTFYARDDFYSYANYLAITYSDHQTVITVVPTVAPSVSEVLPVMVKSLPMILCIVLLVILLSSHYYSSKIVRPITALAHQAIRVSDNTFDVAPLTIKGSDEIATLSKTLNDVYFRLKQNYTQLESENIRQDVFIKSMSHQLKTPISAAMLLTEGMINKVGKYQDTQQYLPQLKTEIKSLKKIVDDVLYLNQAITNQQLVTIDLSILIDEVIASLTTKIKQKSLKITTDINHVQIISDKHMLFIILENLMSNAIRHSKNSATISVYYQDCLYIKNYDAFIKEDMLASIFDPFVTSHADKTGHGLGLYIAKYYAENLNHTLNITNQVDGVVSSLYF